MNSSARLAGSNVHVIAQRAGQRFSLPVATVREVIVMPELEPVPLAPPEVLGSFQLRGEIVPSVLPDRLLAIEHADDTPAVLALLRQHDAIVAVAFDRMLGVAPIDPAELVPHPLAPARPWMPHLYVHPRYQMVTVIDAVRLLNAFIEDLKFSPAVA